MKLAGARERKELIYLPPYPAPPSFAGCFLFSCSELWILCCISCGYQGQPERGRWVIVIQIATNCNSNKARAEWGGWFSTKRLNVHRLMLCPFRNFSLQLLSMKIPQQSLKPGLLFWGLWADLSSTEKYWDGERRAEKLGWEGMQKKKKSDCCSFFFCLSVSRLQTSLHSLNGHQSISLWWNVHP